MTSRIARIRFLDEMARFTSTVLSPLLTPSYAMLMALSISPKVLDSVGSRINLLIIILGITCVLPMATIALLHNFKFIKDKRMVKRDERLLPYIAATVFYLGAVWYLAYTHEPQWMVMFAAGGALTLLVTLLVNRVWKISAHAAGVAGVTTMLYQIKAMNLEVIEPVWMVGILLFSIVCCGVVGSARIVLGKHSLGQVVAGYLNGVACVSLLMRLFG